MSCQVMRKYKGKLSDRIQVPVKWSFMRSYTSPDTYQECSKEIRWKGVGEARGEASKVLQTYLLLAHHLICLPTESLRYARLASTLGPTLGVRGAPAPDRRQGNPPPPLPRAPSAGRSGGPNASATFFWRGGYPPRDGLPFGPCAPPSLGCYPARRFGGGVTLLGRVTHSSHARPPVFAHLWGARRTAPLPAAAKGGVALPAARPNPLEPSP